MIAPYPYSWSRPLPTPKPPDEIHATPLALLKAVHENGCEYASEVDGRVLCFYCGADRPEHDFDCLFKQVEDFLREAGKI